MKKIYFYFLFINSVVFAQGSLCTNPIVITSLPYTTTDNTANYGDNYDPSTDSSPSCSMTTYGNQYHGGDDVIYSYTPQQSGTIRVELPNAIGWSGLFIYNDCADIGISYAACATGVSSGNRTIDNFPVNAGQTYYFFISTWPSPQSMVYTLNVTQLTLGVNEANLEPKLTLYPNPARDELFLNSTITMKEVSLYTINGQFIGNRKVTDNTVSLHGLQSGFYVLQLENEEGVKIFRKFIKS